MIKSAFSSSIEKLGKATYTYKFISLGFDLTNGDKYQYYELVLELGKRLNEQLYLFVNASPFYVGDYGFLDQFYFGIQYEFFNTLNIQGRFSNLKKEAFLEYLGDNMLVDIGFNKVRQSHFESEYVDNFILRVGVLY